MSVYEYIHYYSDKSEKELLKEFAEKYPDIIKDTEYEYWEDDEEIYEQFEEWVKDEYMQEYDNDDYYYDSWKESQL